MCSVPLSGSHTSPWRPRIWRTLAPARGRRDGARTSRRADRSARPRCRSKSLHPDLVALVDVDRVDLRRCRRAPSTSRQLFAAGSYMESWPLFHSLTQMRPRLSLHTRRAPWSFASAARTTRDRRCARSSCAMKEPASEHAPDVAGGRGADAVGAAPARRLPHADLAGAHRDAAHVAGLAGEPEVAVAVEGAGVQVGVRRARGQREHASPRVAASRRARSRSARRR